MQKIKFGILVIAILACFSLLVVCAEDDNYGEDIEFGTPAPDTTEPEQSETTTEPESSTADATTAPAETETTIPEESTTTPSEESVTAGETTEPAETEPESGEGSTERPDVQTTEPIETPSESASASESVTPSESASPSESATPSESETQPEQGASTLPVSLPLILAGLGVLAVGCIAVVVVVMIKYFRAQKA